MGSVSCAQTVGLGDLNHGGGIDSLNVDPFVLALMTQPFAPQSPPALTARWQALAAITASVFETDAFLTCLTDGQCSPCLP